MSKPVKIVTLQPVAPLYRAPQSQNCNADAILPLVKENARNIASMAESAAVQRPDVICAPEDVGGMNVYMCQADGGRLFRSVVEAASREVIHELSEAARRARSYIVASVYEIMDGDIYNSGILFNRNGALVGRYLKSHLPASEKYFVERGNDYPVFDTDFGTVGILICYDFHFPEPTQLLSLNGADIVLVPIYGWSYRGEANAEARTRTRALDNSVFIVTSSYASALGNAPGRSQIVHPNGLTLADAGYQPNVSVVAQVDLDDATYYEETDSEESGVPNVRARNIFDRRPETYSGLSDHHPPIASRFEDIRYNTASEIEQLWRRRAASGVWRAGEEW